METQHPYGDFLEKVKITDNGPIFMNKNFRSDDSPTKHQVMSNYFSIGVDAELALKFHTERENHPEKFRFIL